MAFFLEKINVRIAMEKEKLYVGNVMEAEKNKCKL